MEIPNSPTESFVELCCLADTRPWIPHKVQRIPWLQRCSMTVSVSFEPYSNLIHAVYLRVLAAQVHLRWDKKIKLQFYDR
jgi:hypothetical protein